MAGAAAVWKSAKLGVRFCVFAFFWVEFVW